MQGSIAQTLALTIGGNAFLQGLPIPNFMPDGSAFRFCSVVQFLEAREPTFGEHDALFGAFPKAWLDRLRHQGCAGLRVRVMPGRKHPGFADRMTVSFVGGGSRWLMQEIGTSPPTYWEDSWRAWKDAPNGRPWYVRYNRLAEAVPDEAVPADSIDQAHDRLGQALTTILAFAERNGLRFIPYFTAGLDCLSSETPLAKAYHADFGPPGFLSQTACQVLGACQASWVFGGMGWWNDGAYGGALTAEGDILSEALFGALQGGLAAVANSTAPPPASSTPGR